MISEPTNDDRRARAQKAIDAYCEAQGIDIAVEGPGTALTDLLTDLRHWAAVTTADFDTSVRLSEDHFKEESRAA